MNTEDMTQAQNAVTPVLPAAINRSRENIEDPDARTKLVYFFLILWLLSVVTIPLSRMQILEGQSPDLFTIADIISYPSFLAFVVAYFIWLSRVTENALLLSPVHKATFSPLRHFLYYILPVWNLYGPYDGMKIVYGESRKASTGEQQPSLLPVCLWWLLVLNAVACPYYLPGARSLYRIIFLFPNNPPSPSLFSLFLASLFTMAAGLATFFIIRQTTLYQKEIIAEREQED